MSYCSKCGRRIIDEEYGCPYCKESTSNYYGEYKPQEEGLSNGIKVALVSLACLIPFGFVAGIIVGAVFIGKSNIDYKSFGKALMILCIILLSLSLLCCIAITVFGFYEFGSSEGYFYDSYI